MFSNRSVVSILPEAVYMCELEKRADESGRIVPWDLDAIAEDARAKGLTQQRVSA